MKPVSVPQRMSASEAVGPGSIPHAGYFVWTLAMDSFIRFQTTMPCPTTGKRLGVFHAAYYVEEEDVLSTEAYEKLKDSFAWFAKHLRSPALRGKPTRGVFWFRSAAEEFISRVWDIVDVLQSADVIVERHATKRPGAIVYSDDQQIVAIPYRKPRRIRIHTLRV